MGQYPMTVVAWQPRKSGVPVPVQGPPGEQLLLLFWFATHLPLGHWLSAVQ
jgi:hypothetical protein